MGYYTVYHINYKVPEGVDKEKFSHDLARGLYAVNSDYFDDFVYIENCLIEDLIESDMMKWYDHEEDMCELSKLFPNILFTLEGFGEEQGDIWREYFYNGKFQYAPATIIFDEFDENKLKELSV